MGPFGVLVILPMFPELRNTFETTNQTVSWGLTAYLLPMSTLLLVSGTIGERFGRQRVLRLAFGLFALASVATAMAPSLLFFIAGRALQGVCNAFFTPLLLAGLADLTPAASLGRKIGVYSSFQAAGGAFAPAVGGIAADANWRVAFVGTALVSFMLIFATPSTEARRAPEPPSITTLFNRRVLLIGLAAFFAAAGPYGGNVLVGIKARDILGLTATQAGLLILGGSLSGLALAPFWGSLIDRVGSRFAALAATGLTSISLAVAGFTDTTLSLAIAWTITGGFIVGIVVVLQNLGATAVPSNRSGGLSATMAFRFLGHAAGPVAFIPIFERESPSLAFGWIACLGAIASAVLWIATRRTPVPN